MGGLLIGLMAGGLALVALSEKDEKPAVPPKSEKEIFSEGEKAGRDKLIEEQEAQKKAEADAQKAKEEAERLNTEG